MTANSRVLILILIMSTVSLTIAGIVGYVLFQASMDEQRDRLRLVAQSEASLIDSTVGFLRDHGMSDQAEQISVGIIVDALGQYEGFGSTGEFTLAKREGDQIIFYLSHRQGTVNNPRPIPFHSDLAEPMKQALLGQSGSIVGRDYQGEMVLAAYEPVKSLDFGIVAKIDLKEIRAPFVDAMLAGVIGAIALITLGIFLFVRITEPMISELAESKRKLEVVNVTLTESLAERAASEERFRLFLEVSPDALLVANSVGEIVLVNTQTEKLFGYGREDLFSMTVESLVPENARAEHASNRQRFMAEGKVRRMDPERDLHGLRHNGEKFPIDVSLSPMSLNDEKMVIAIIRDTSFMKRIQAQLLQSSKLASLGEMATSVAHELNQPLQVIQSAAEVINMHTAHDAGPMRRSLDLITGQISRASHLTSNLRRFGRDSTSQNREPSDINELAADIVELFRKQLGLVDIRLISDLADDLPDVNCNAYQIEQVLNNLITNARDAVSTTEKKEITVSTALENGEIIVKVMDTGKGVLESDRGDIFTPFFTTKIADLGTGLGLSIAYGIIKDHGGQLALNPNPEGGSTFEFNLPVTI